MNAAFDQIRVVDLSGSIAGQYCTRLLADFGAEVLLAEPDDGSAVQRIGPFDQQGRSLTHMHINKGKKTVAFPHCADALGELARDADVIVVAQGMTPAIEALGIERLICVEISPFGDDGPLSKWRGNEMVYQALSGMMSNNGEAGREPLYGVGNRASYAAGVAGFISATTALYARNRTGAGQSAHIDIAETTAAMCMPYALQYAYNGTDRRRGDQDIPAGQVKCRGTWVCIWIYPHRFSAMCKVLGLEHLIEDARFAHTDDRVQNWSALFEIIQQQVQDCDAEDIVARLQRAQVISACAYRPSELLDSPHLIARGYWEMHAGQDLPVLGPPFRMSGTPRTPADLIDAEGP